MSGAIALITTASLTAAASAAPSSTSGTPGIGKAAAGAPDGLTPFTTVTGKVYMSEDGIGTNDPAGGPIRVQKNNSSDTVQAAYLLAAGIPGYTLVNGDVTLNGNPLSFSPSDSIVGNFGVNSVWTNVTSIVKPVVDSAPVGNVQFTAAEPNNTNSIDGEILAVIMNDPTLPSNNTVSFLFGALDTTGDTFSIGLASPLNLSDPNLGLTMSIGDSFGYQGPPATGQFSTINVNGTLMTSSAGGNDDSICKNDTPQDFAACSNGELITVGGIGDSTANPPDPTATDATCGAPGPPRCDDELYNLLPFVHNGDTSIKVDTANPSNNDNIFFTGFQLNSTAAVVGKGVVLTPVSGTNPVNSPYTFTAKVQDSNGNPIVNQAVNFVVLSGPNAGKTGMANTNASGDATFTYTGTAAGTDSVQASFTDANSMTFNSNEATVKWSAGGNTCPPAVKHVLKIGNPRLEIVRVLILGKCFTGATKVLFGNIPAGTFMVTSDGTIQASPPQQPAGTVDVTVTTPGGGTSAINPPADQYTYFLPQIDLVAPAQGPVSGGNTVIIHGFGFSGTPAPTVSFGAGNFSSSVVVSNDGTIHALVPPHGKGTVDVQVTTFAGASLPTPVDHYTYK
jgi:hypothetical protein